MSEFTPPRGAEFFAAAIVADPELRDAVVGDLSEEYASMRQTRTAASANAWYWSQLIRSAIPFSTMAVARGGWRGWARLTLAVVLGSVVHRGLAVVTLPLLYETFGGGPNPVEFVLVSVVSAILFSTTSGFIAALLGGRSPLAAALGLGICYTAQRVFLAVEVANGWGVFQHAVIPNTRWVLIALSLVAWPLIVMPGFAIGALLRARALVVRPTAP